MLKNNIQKLLIALATLMLLWVLPWALKLATNEASRYPFTYYSCLNHEFIQVYIEKGQVHRIDLKGNEYTEEQYDSILPMLNYRQLLKDDVLPDSINGVEVSGKILQHNQFFFRYNPRDFNTKSINLYPMFESMSGRVNLESPDDMFTLANDIHFIDAESNQVNAKKSQIFQTALFKRGFQFPAQWLVGNPTTKKMYDEGWFALDAKGDLFHIKMVNGKPFVKNTNASKEQAIVYMKTIETANHRTYGFIFDAAQGISYLSDVNYEPIKLPIDDFDPKTDQLSIMANLFYWNVVVTKANERNYYVLDNNSLELVDSYTENKSTTLWEKIQPWVFPVYIELKDVNSVFVHPRFNGWSVNALALHGIIVLLMVGLNIIKKQKVKPVNIIFVLIGGLAAWIALGLFKSFKFNITDSIQLT